MVEVLNIRSRLPLEDTRKGNSTTSPDDLHLQYLQNKFFHEINTVQGEPGYVEAVKRANVAFDLQMERYNAETQDYAGAVERAQNKLKAGKQEMTQEYLAENAKQARINAGLPAPWEQGVTDFALNHPETLELHETLDQNPNLARQVVADTGGQVTTDRPLTHQAAEAIRNGDVLINSPTGKRIYPLDDPTVEASAPPPGPTPGAPTPAPSPTPSPAPVPTESPAPVVQNSGNALSKETATINPLDSKALGFWASMFRPQTAWKAIGKLGKDAAALFTSTKENYRMAHAAWMGAYQKAVSGLDAQSKRRVVDLLNFLPVNRVTS